MDIVYQRFVSDYSLAIASLDLTDISCSYPTYGHIMLAKTLKTLIFSHKNRNPIHSPNPSGQCWVRCQV